MQIWSNLEIRVCNTSKKFSVAAKASDANIAFLLPIARISKSCHSQIWELQGNITMVLNTSERTLSYRRAEWFDCEASSISLEICLRDACLKLKSTEDRSIELNGGKLVTGIAVKDKKPGYLLHLTTELPGESASIVPSISKSVAEVDVTTVAPPVNHEFVDGDAFLYVKGNDVCLCATGLRDGGIEYFLHALFKRAKIRKDSANFFLIKAADMKKVAMINSYGVKEVEIRASFFQASADYERRKAQPASILGAAVKHAKAILKKDNDVTSDALKASLTIKLDRRIVGGISLGETRLALIAKEILKTAEGEDDFVILTNNDQRISPQEIFVREKVEIEKSGKSLNRDKAWKAVLDFHKKLESSGVLQT